MAFLRLIGDVHGHYSQYIKIAQGAKYSIQVGDVGFDYRPLEVLDPTYHKICLGNHDNYEKFGTSKFLCHTEHMLGDFGVYTVPEFGDIFFVRGGNSIDKAYRHIGLDWWPDEELSKKQMDEALELYISLKPEFVISHECPGSLIVPAFGQKTWDGELLRPSMTAKLLDEMWSNHSPRRWVFGHHHKKWTETLNGTIFHCLPELGYIDLDKDKFVVFSNP